MNNRGLTAGQLRRIKTALQQVPFARLLGIELEGIEAGAATLGLNIRSELKQNNGVVHGGAVASLIDTAAAFAVISALSPDERATTVDLTISYLRPLTQGRATCIARVLRAGRRLIVVSASISDETGTLVATALTTYTKISKRPRSR